MTAHNIQIDLSSLRSALEQPLSLVTDPDARERVQAYIAAATPHVERATFDVISQAVNAFREASPETRVRLEYAEGRLTLDVDDQQETGVDTPFDDKEVEKVTLRLPRELKNLINASAGQHGISANNWYVRALSRMMVRNLRDSIRGSVHEGEWERRRRGVYRGRGHHDPD
jgi:predicted HicB family RNase H-like nuclease